MRTLGIDTDKKKWCSACAEYKLLSEFGKSIRTKSGLCCYCKVCNCNRGKNNWLNNLNEYIYKKMIKKNT